MSYEQAKNIVDGMKRVEATLTAENWNHTPNVRKNVFLKGKESTPLHYLRRISTLTNNELDGLDDKAKDFVVDLIRWVLEANPKVTYSTNKPNKSRLTTYLNGHKFSDVFGIKKKTDTGHATDHEDITEHEIQEYVDLITERTAKSIPVHNPKKIRRGQALALALRLFNYAKGIIKQSYPQGVIPPESYQRTLQALIMTWGDVGTTKAIDYSDVEITIFYRETPTSTTRSRFDTDGLALIVPTLDTLPSRRAARYFALPAANFAKQHNHKYAVGLMHGVPPQYGYLGFDFADVLVPANNTEAIVISQARNAGLFNDKNKEGQVTNTSARYQTSGYVNSMITQSK